MVKTQINISVAFKLIISCLLTVIAHYHSIPLVVEAYRGRHIRIGAIVQAVGILRAANVIENWRVAIRGHSSNNFTTWTNNK